MRLFSSHRAGLFSSTLGPALLALSLVLHACSTPPQKPPLPPSETDLILLRTGKLCDSKRTLFPNPFASRSKQESWGIGEKITSTGRRDLSKTLESYFFDPEGTLIGFHMAFPEGLSLEPYPVLRKTLVQLPPSVEFFRNLESLEGTTAPLTTTLFLTGEEKSTTQYLVTGPIDSAKLLSVSISVDPYVDLLSPYRKEFLERLGKKPQDAPTPQRIQGPGSHDKEPFVSRQQFARGETALLAYCGVRHDDIAKIAYQQAIQEGFSNKQLLAEAHHKLGLTMKSQGKLAEARQELQTSLKILPDRPDVLNNLGHIYKELGDRQKAIATIERAVGIRPNYPLARFNLAELYEKVNRRRAISEYETYLALAEGVFEEAKREVIAQERLKALAP